MTTEQRLAALEETVKHLTKIVESCSASLETLRANDVDFRLRLLSEKRRNSPAELDKLDTIIQLLNQVLDKQL